MKKTKDNGDQIPSAPKSSHQSSHLSTAHRNGAWPKTLLQSAISQSKPASFNPHLSSFTVTTLTAKAQRNQVSSTVSFVLQTSMPAANVANQTMCCVFARLFAPHKSQPQQPKGNTKPNIYQTDTKRTNYKK